MNDDSFEEEDRTICSVEVSIAGERTGSTAYLLKLSLLRHDEARTVGEVRAKLVVPGAKGKPNNVVGYLEGTLLRRPDPHFFELADEVSQEMQELAVTFCNSKGIADRIKHPSLREDPTAVNGGGFLQICMIEIRSEHQKKDLGLRMVHETLVFLRGGWTLAVVIPGLITNSFRKWLPPGLTENDRNRDSTPAEKAVFAAQQLKIRKHYCRMGFNQAGRNRGLESFFFLTSGSYLPRGSDPAAAMDQWISKDNAGDIDVFVAPERQIPSGLDEELRNKLIKYRGTPGEDFIRSISGLVERGASINGAGAMHIAAANGESLGPPILRELVRLGGEVDGADDSGNTPLHVAATKKSLSSIEYLLACRASRTLQNDDGDTPLMCVERASRDADDFSTAMGMNLPPREMDIIPKHQSMTLLMDQSLQTHLIEGWLSPRMREMLQITAEIQGDHLFHDFDLNEIMLFIPTETRQNLSAYFSVGVGIVFETVARLLRAGRAPTVDRIKRSALQSTRGIHNFTRMLNAGGKVEFVLDALFYITEKVLVDGDCGWEYETFKDQIEAHPVTPLDGSFDIAFFMCINRGGGSLLESRGPHGDSHYASDYDY
jgi:hypothetical protein